MAETIEAQLHLLYHAGKVSFPARAETLAQALDLIGDVHEGWHDPTVRAGSPPALVAAMAINAEVYQLLRRAVLSWQDAAYSLISIADDFVETDANAAAAARQVGFSLDDVPVPKLSTPPTLGDR